LHQQQNFCHFLTEQPEKTGADIKHLFADLGSGVRASGIVEKSSTGLLYHVGLLRTYPPELFFETDFFHITSYNF
jgi:hypothetical protein